MGKGAKVLFNIIFIGMSCLWTYSANGQAAVIDSLVHRGDSLRRAYDFESSMQAYNDALAQFSDTLVTAEDSLLQQDINERLTLSENGRNMCSFVYDPIVVAKRKFSIDDFFLYYPLPDRSWRSNPNQLDSLPEQYAKAIYAPEQNDTIYFSARDAEGIRNIYRTTFADSLWSVPSLLNEHMTSVSNEIYPMLSADGHHLYFASEGLYGVGGYDLYVSEWDEDSQDWSVPVNMGFPYSSPSNDFLLINSADSKYTVFASDRGCSSDSLWVYVLEYDNKPVRKSVFEPSALASLSLLEPTSSISTMSSAPEIKSNIPENEDTRQYSLKMVQITALRDSIFRCESYLAECREKYALISDDSDRQKASEQILKFEAKIPVYQSELAQATKELQQIEMNFLLSGVVIDPAKLLAEAEREVVATTAGYTFSKNLFGDPLSLKMAERKPAFDYTFKIQDTTQIIRGVSIPEGIVYQIQILTSHKPVLPKSLKGLSPVFETETSSGRYIYRAGLFNAYSDVISHLNAVKRLGFKSAYVVAFIDGQEMQVGVVRNAENSKKAPSDVLYRVTISPTEEGLDSVSVAGIRQQAEGKDIAKDENGFMVGPFDNQEEAEKLVEFITVMGYGEAKIEKL